MSSPLSIIYDMVMLVLTNTISTLVSVFTLFNRLVGGLFSNGAEFGAAGLFIALLVAGIVAFFIGKLFLNSWKMIILLFAAAFILIVLLGGAFI